MKEYEHDFIKRIRPEILEDVKRNIADEADGEYFL